MATMSDLTVEVTIFFFFFFQAEDGIRVYRVTGVQTCALPISVPPRSRDCCASTYAVGRWRDPGVWASVAFPPLRAAFSPCPAGARGSRFPPHDDSGGPLGAPEGRRTVPTAPRGGVRGAGGRARRGAGPRGRGGGARAVAGGRADR